MEPCIIILTALCLCVNNKTNAIPTLYVYTVDVHKIISKKCRFVHSPEGKALVQCTREERETPREKRDSSREKRDVSCKTVVTYSTAQK